MRFPHPTFSALRMAVSFLLICATSAVAQFGPDEPVTVHRDTADVPHIFGSTDAAAFYAFGRSQMSDLPVTTALNLASAAGESALYLGAGPGDGPGFYIDADLETLHWRIPAIASQQLAQLDSSTFRRLRAYVAGVNRARNDWLLDLSPLVLNTEPVNLDLSQLQSLLGRSVSVHDVLCHGLQMNGGPSMIAARDLAENYIPEDLLKTASNGWLIGSGASSSGNPITLADPHIGFETSPRYRAYFAQIKGTNHHACGISFPGWPCITIGFNDAISWVMTSNNPDILDVWEVDLEPGGQHYLLDGIPTPMIRMPLNVSYLNGNGGVSVYQEWRSYAGSVEYPVLDESNDNGVTRVRFARASFTTGPSIFEFFLKLGDATTLPEAFQAMQLNAVTYSNFLVADTNGAMGYIWNGRIPRRGEATPGTTWAEVQDGSSSAYRWLGFHSTNELPSEVISGQQSANLAISDQIWINNNVRADLVRPGTSLDLSNFPEYMVHAAQTQTNFRQLRAVELLRDPGVPISTAENEIISTDQRDNWTVAMMPLIETAAARYGLHASPDVRDLFVKLRAWDGDATRDSEVAVYAYLIQAWFEAYLLKMEEAGYKVAPERFRIPGEIPDAQAFKIDSYWLYTLVALAGGVYHAAFLGDELLNPTLSGLQSPNSPWTPDPFNAMSSQVPMWGSANYLDLTPAFAPLDWAIYPIGGSANALYTVWRSEFTDLIDALQEEVGLAGMVGPLLTIPVDSGTHTILQVELSSPPKARYLEAIGPTEIADDPRRYANAQNFANRVFIPFECDQLTLAASANQTFNWLFSPASAGL